MSPRETAELSIAEQAAQWLCELGDETQDRRAQFVRWLRESPRHVEEFLLTTSVWRAFDEAGSADADRIARAIESALAEASEPTNIVALPGLAAGTDNAAPPSIQGTAHENAVDARPTPGRNAVDDVLLSRAVRRRRWMAAAAVVCIVGAGAILAPRFGLFGTVTYSTGVGEQRAFRLADSSVVYLNAQSRVEVRYSDEARELHLLAGEALFTVAAERSRPFRVNAGNSVIQALGTQFNVYRHAAMTTVSVLEGAVQILPKTAAATPSTTAPADAPTRLSRRLDAGEQANITSNGHIVSPDRTDIADAVAWRDRRVVFRAERLEDIAAEFSRYSPRPIRIEGETARNKRLTASFAADDPESLMLFLAKEKELVVEQDGEGFLVRTR